MNMEFDNYEKYDKIKAFIQVGEHSNEVTELQLNKYLRPLYNIRLLHAIVIFYFYTYRQR